MTAPAPAPLASGPAIGALRTVAVLGNPNVGKSTLFNALTGLSQRVANYAGVTVDASEGHATTPLGPVRLVDLPGTYSLCPSAADEAIVLRALTGEARPDLLLVILDATNLRRNLFLLTEAADLGLPTVVALNMVDEARRAGIAVPSARLAELLGVPVVETVATTGEGLDALRAELAKSPPCPARGWRFADPALEARVGEGTGGAWERLCALREAEPGLREREVGGRYAWITQALLGSSEDPSALRARSERIDGVLLHPLLGPLLFLAVMGLVFQSIFTGAEPAMGVIEGAFKAVGEWAAARLEAWPTLASLVQDGVVAGVGAVVVFLPQILILFFFIGLLEDTGYMARAAFLVDRPLRALGLSGRSFIPLLSSFACAIPGVMATRTIPGRLERLAAILVAPLMTCSARLPVYTLLVGTFVPRDPVWLPGAVLFGLYFMGMAAGALVALVVSRFRVVRGKELPLVVELPPYRRPSLRSVLMKLKVRGGDFLKRAGTVIFLVTVALWVLAYFPRHTPRPDLSERENRALQSEQSWAGSLGRAIEPVIRPLGYDWKIGVGLIASFAAREVFVGAMGVIYSVEDAEGEGGEERLGARLRAEVDPRTGRPVFTGACVASLLAFYVFALQCASTVAVVKRETSSWRFALGQLVLYLVMAWVAAFAAYRIGLALGWG